jgi:hypothetical protein
MRKNVVWTEQLHLARAMRGLQQALAWGKGRLAPVGWAGKNLEEHGETRTIEMCLIDARNSG